MVLGLTAQQVSERAGITRDTLRKIEAGNPGVGFGNVAQVLRAPGALDQAVHAIDPLESDIGRLRAGSLRRSVRDTTVEVFIDRPGTLVWWGGSFTRQRGPISTTFLYDPVLPSPEGGMSIDPALPLVSGAQHPVEDGGRVGRRLQPERRARARTDAACRRSAGGLARGGTPEQYP